MAPLRWSLGCALFPVLGCQPSPLPMVLITDAAADRGVGDGAIDAVSDTLVDVVPDQDGPDVRRDVGPDVIPDVMPDVGADVMADVGMDSGTDVLPDVGTDIGVDVIPDVGTDAGALCSVPDGGGSGSYAATVEPIVLAHCAVSMCHDAVTRQAAMDLSAGHGYASLVCAHASIGCPSATLRVIPGSSGTSVMWQRVSGTCYQQMPLGPDGMSHPLAMDTLAVIQRWIDDGALP